MILVLFIALFTFIGFGLDVWVSMGFSSILYILLRGDVSLRLIASQMISGVSADTLLAIPFFIMAGNLMGTSGITNKLLKFANYFVGKYRAGQAYVSILVSVFLAGVSGSAVSDASTTSSILQPIMEKTAPTSTLCNTFAINMLMLTAVAKLSERGIEVPLWTSANLPGGDEKNKKLEEQYAPLVKHL